MIPELAEAYHEIKRLERTLGAILLRITDDPDVTLAEVEDLLVAALAKREGG